MNKPLDTSKLNHALQLLNEQLLLTNSPHTEIVVCGGSALIAMSLVPRTTQDIDIVAMIQKDMFIKLGWPNVSARI